MATTHTQNKRAKTASQRYKVISIVQLEDNHGQLEGLPRNPRFIKDQKFRDLCCSLERSPEFLEANPLKVYPLKSGNYIVLAGNMRLRACRELGWTTVPCYVFPKNTPKAKLREFATIDNIAFGQTDWEALKEWNAEELKEWSFDYPDGWDEELPPLEGEEEPEELTAEAKEKPFKISITCTDRTQLLAFSEDVRELIENKYEGADYSISGGEL